MGWCLEVAYAFYQHKKFVNRGFLLGPYCPLYGSCAVLMIYILDPFKNNIIMLFILGVIVTTLIEYFTGFVLQKVFNTRWWDYSDEALNIGGFICLKFSIIWGAISVIFIKLINPIVSDFLNPVLYSNLGILLTIAAFCLMLVDFIYTIKSLANFNGLLTELHDISKEFKIKSLYVKEESAEKTEALVEEFKGKYEAILSKLQHNYSRFTSVMPEYKVENLKTHFNTLKNKVYSKNKDKN